MRLIRVLAPLALASALLAGCGTDSGGLRGGDTPSAPTSPTPTDNGVAALEPDAIVEKAKAALNAAKSFSIKGDIKEGAESLTLDIRISGTDLKGTMTVNGATAELLRVAGQAYLRGNEKLWSQVGGAAGPTLTQLLGDRWAKLPAKDADLDGFFSIADSDHFLTPSGKVTKGSTKTVNGIQAIGLVDNAKDGGTLYVATTGEPYPLMLEGPSGEGQATFGDFGATFDDIKAPAANEVIDLDKLAGN